MDAKKQLLIDLLTYRKKLVEQHRSSIQYGEWSCGQQDADAEQAEWYDITMRNALKYTEDKSYADKLNEQEIEAVYELVKDVIEDFRQSAEFYFGVY